MSGFSWTDEQEAAITAADAEVLVAAGAGTGKTAVLVERVIRLITRRKDPVAVDELLVVTYTDAAAGEMRQRIAEALTRALLAEPDSTHLRQQLSLLPKARITTLHSFCLWVVRRYFHRLGLDPAFRILDSHEAQLLRYDVVDDLLESALQQPAERPGFTTLLNHYGGQAGERLKELILQLHDQYAVQDNPRRWLANLLQTFQTDGDQGPPAIMASLREMVDFRLQLAAWNLQQSAALCKLPGAPAEYLSNLRAEQSLLAETRQLAYSQASFTDLLAAVDAITFRRLPRAGDDTDEDLKKRVTNLRDRAKTIVRDLLAQLGSQGLADQLADLAGLAAPMQALTQLVLDFDAQFRRAKDAYSGLDFSDLERFCLQLLQANDDGEPSDIALSLRRQFRQIIVDEYQDINPAQEAILNLVAQGTQPGEVPNRFAVGDVKQSIYRFRLAEPGIFLHKYNTFALADGGRDRRIDLQTNFRSRDNILRTVNFVFRQLFSAALGELGYSESAWLQYGGGYPPDSPDPPVELHILERDNAILQQVWGATANRQDNPLNYTTDEREALLVARRIQELLTDGQVWDKKTETMRPVNLSDIAILMRSPRHRANSFVEILAQAGIPVTANLTTGYFDATEVATVLALLQVLDNPQQDIPLAAVLHSPLVGLDANDLVRVRLARPDGKANFFVALTARAEEDDALGRRLAKFLSQLADWRTLARRGRLADLIWAIYTKTSYLEYVGGLPDGAQRRANLIALHQRARDFDGFARRGLLRFLRFIQRLENEGEDVGAPAAGTRTEEAVQLMSVHRSKGLEFPIVFLCDLGRQINLTDLAQPILVHRQLGLGPNVVQPQVGLTYPSLARYALRHQLHKEAIAEEMRVLYVAMTRAREQLIMVGSVRDCGEACSLWTASTARTEEALPDPYLAAADRPLDWLASALARHAKVGTPLRHGSATGFAPRPAQPELAHAAIDGRIHLWSAQGLQQLCPGVEPSTLTVPTNNSKTEVEPSGEEIDRRATELIQQLDWQSPYRPLADAYAKVRATEIKNTRAAQLEQLTAGEEEGAPGAAPTRPQPPLARPRFMQKETKVTPLELGSAAHLILQHVPLVPAPGRDELAQTAHSLTAAGLLSEKAAQAVDLATLASFFASPLGHALTTAAAKSSRAVAREVPFSMRVPAHQAYPDLSQQQFDAEWVLVQGIIDCLFTTEEGIVLIDFKTDRVGPQGVQQAAAFYTDQVKTYSRAAQHLYQQPLAGAYLYFLTPGKAVKIR